MNCLTDSYSADNLLNSRFSSVIVTDIVRIDGKRAQMFTLLPWPSMFEEIVMGINKSLKSSGIAARWQCRIYSFREGQFTKPITYAPITCENND